MSFLVTVMNWGVMFIVLGVLAKYAWDMFHEKPKKKSVGKDGGGLWFKRKNKQELVG